MNRIILFAAIVAGICLASCSHNVDYAENQKSLKEIYENSTKLPGHSLIQSYDLKESRVGLSMLTITEEDVQYITSLSKSDIEKERKLWEERMGSERIAQIEEKKAVAMAKKFDILGGHEGIDRLKEFASQYLLTAGGWQEIERLMPAGMNRKQSEVYVGISVFIDRIARPLYSGFISKAQQTRSSSVAITGDDKLPEAYCKMALQDHFRALGLNMDVDAFISAMNSGDGASTDYDLIDNDGNYLAFDPYEIWDEYRMCLLLYN